MANKKTLLGMLAIVLVFGMAVSEVYGQSSNHVPRLIGTYTDIHNNQTVVFNADGTGIWGPNAFRFGAVGDKVVIIFNNGPNFAYNLVLSSDGNTLLLSHLRMTSRDGTNMAGWVLQRR